MRAATLTGYIEVARHVGLDPFELLRSYEISPTFLDDPENRHAAEPIVELLEESARQSNCGAFGLLMAECRSFAELGPLCLLLERLPNVRSVVNALGEYRRHFNDIMNIALDESGETPIVQVELLPEFAFPQITDFTIARLYRNLSGASGGRWQPLCLHLMPLRPYQPIEYRVWSVMFSIDWNSQPDRATRSHKSSTDFRCRRSSVIAMLVSAIVTMLTATTPT